jgi:hypothetical protein
LPGLSIEMTQRGRGAGTFSDAEWSFGGSF